MQSDPSVNVLLVDDHPENLVALESVLERLGVTLRKAHSGMEALKWILEEDFAVILLDVQMPDMDGFETATLIRARERSRHIPIIFLTAINKSETHIFQGYSVGALDYVVKPFEPEVLRAKVAAFVEMYRNTRKLQDEILHRRKTEAKLDASNALLETISRALMSFIADGNPLLTFERLLHSLLTLTQSEYGFIGEILATPRGQPYLKTFVVAEANARKKPRNGGKRDVSELDAEALKTLCGIVRAENRPFFANDAETLALAQQLGLTNVPLQNFLALPLMKGRSLVGIIGIANRMDGYDEGLTAYLEPCCHTCASLIDAQRNALRRQLAEEAVREMNEELECRVTERTAEWQAANRELQSEIQERRRAEEILARHQAHIENLNARLRRSMTETHHRVKNNLQIIASMLDMRLLECEQSIPASEIQQLGFHVRTLAAVHDLLTQEAKEDGEAHTLSARRILNKLLPMLQETAEGRTIQFELEDVRLSARQGTSLALVVNELISNAIKYSKEDIEVRLAVVAEQAELIVMDHGPGFPHDFDPVRAANTGLDLVLHLSRWDLGGATHFENRAGGGACVRLVIPLSQESALEASTPVEAVAPQSALR
ncbi:MAG TPA: response regulator [Chthonomonadaceae bacterium]|nr:response regulator [Chthonomonadaceae bacterium]